MPPLLIAATTPDDPGFLALRSESLAQHFNMLRRLAENWQSGKNRFNAPGETLLGAFVNHQLVGVCGINSDPFSPQPRAGRIRHLYISERYREGKVIVRVRDIERLLAVVGRDRGLVTRDDRVLREAEALVKKLGVPVSYEPTSQAFYQPGLDRITVPERSQYKDSVKDGVVVYSAAAKHYSVLLHECCHATGHESRLKRMMSGAMGSPEIGRGVV